MKEFYCEGEENVMKEWKKNEENEEEWSLSKETDIKEETEEEVKMKTVYKNSC